MQVNEKIKAVSSLVSNLGAALFASGLARWFFTGLDPWVAIWVVFGAVISCVGIHLLSYLSSVPGD